MQTETPREDITVISSDELQAAQDSTPEQATVEQSTESTANPANGEQAPEPQPPELPKGVQRKINKLTRKAGDAERTAREYALELELAKERLKHYEAQQPAAKPQPEDAEPTLEQFNFDITAYTKAMSKYEARQTLTQWQQQQAQAQRQQEFQKKVATLSQKEAAFVAEHPDYEEVAKDPSLPITEVMAEAIFDSDHAPAIAYYLGQHPEEAASISQMSPVAAGRAIGRIEAKVSASAPQAPVPRRTPAPPPVTVLNSTAPVSKTYEAMSMEEYAAKRKQERLARQP